MKLIKCLICNQSFESIRNSKLCCSVQCEKIRKSNYDRDRYYEFRNTNRKRRREMLLEKYSVDSMNPYKLKGVCDNCLTEFYWDYAIYHAYSNVHVDSYNCTPWGVPYCPRCGLVEKSIYDYHKIPKPKNATDKQCQDILEEIRYVRKIPYIRRQALYMGKYIDFISESEFLRRQRNRISDIGDLTLEEINICIKAILKKR